jgi:membrane protease YdiL (CAAX protease family)
VNAPALQILDLQAGELIDKSFAEALIVRPDLADVTDSIVDAMYAPNNVLTRDVAVGQRDARRHLVIRTSMLHDEQRSETQGVVAIISDISDQIRALRERIEFGHLLVVTIATMAIANIITLLVDRYLDVNVHTPAFAWAYLMMLALPVIGSVVWLGYSAGSIGLTLRNWRQGVIEGVPVALLLTAMLGVTAYLARPDLAERAFDDDMRLDGLAPSLLSYAPHSFLQEVLARGVLQNSLRRVLNDRLGIASVVVGSLMFGLFHSYLGLVGIAVTTVSGVIFGCLFIRHGNLIGATIVHVVGGEAAFALSVM